MNVFNVGFGLKIKILINQQLKVDEVLTVVGKNLSNRMPQELSVDNNKELHWQERLFVNQKLYYLMSLELLMQNLETNAIILKEIQKN